MLLRIYTLFDQPVEDIDLVLSGTPLECVFRQEKQSKRRRVAAEYVRDELNFRVWGTNFLRTVKLPTPRQLGLEPRTGIVYTDQYKENLDNTLVGIWRAFEVADIPFAVINASKDVLKLETFYDGLSVSRRYSNVVNGLKGELEW